MAILIRSLVFDQFDLMLETTSSRAIFQYLAGKPNILQVFSLTRTSRISFL